MRIAILRFVLLTLCFSSLALGQALKVTLLGTGNPRPSIDRFGPSILVEAGKETLLFDCGRGATIRLSQAGIPFSSVTALFLTHLHSDHVVGVPDLWLTGWIMGRDVPLQVWGPAGTTDMLKHLKEAYAFDIHVRRDVDEQLPPQGAGLTGKDIDEGVVYENNGVKVTAFRVDHGLVKPALGYRIDYHGHSVVLSGDTRPSDNLVKFARGTDLLVHEVFDPEAYHDVNNSLTTVQRDRVRNHHTTPEEAGRIFTRVAPKMAVYSHIVPPDVPNVIPHTRKTYSGPLEVGEDLMTIEVGEQIRIQRPTPRNVPKATP
jgi:ribonuclease Z